MNKEFVGKDEAFAIIGACHEVHSTLGDKQTNSLNSSVTICENLWTNFFLLLTALALQSNIVPRMKDLVILAPNISDMAYVNFEESQYFRSSWVGLFVFVIVILSAVLPFLIPGEGQQSREIVLVSLMPLAILVLFWFMGLKTRIDKDGIYYRFFPFHFKEKYIAWADVEKMEVIQYSPLADYGGWGIRYGRKGKAFNVSGNKGLFLTLKSGKHLLFGTKKEEEMREVVGLIARNELKHAEKSL